MHNLRLWPGRCGDKDGTSTRQVAELDSGTLNPFGSREYHSTPVSRKLCENVGSSGMIGTRMLSGT
jgi:hypothetical protein